MPDQIVGVVGAAEPRAAQGHLRLRNHAKSKVDDTSKGLEVPAEVSTVAPMERADKEIKTSLTSDAFLSSRPESRSRCNTSPAREKTSASGTAKRSTER
jgi:hypothetical protein